MGADPEAEADAWYFYRTHGYWPHGYGHLAYSYAPYAYAGHYGYYGLGHHHGYYGRKKREATAEADADASPEADPWLLYGGYYGRTCLWRILRLRIPPCAICLPW